MDGVLAVKKIIEHKLVLIGPIGETKENCDFLAERINSFVDTKKLPKKRNLNIFERIKSLLSKSKIIIEIEKE
jgi:hypothetical protein